MLLYAGFIIILFLMFFGAPVYLALGGGALFLTLFYLGLPPANASSWMFESVSSFTLLAVPFFILTGSLMSRGGASKYLVDCINSWAGHLPGGLASVAVLSCGIFGAISGSGTADTAAIASAIQPDMTRTGYPKYFSSGLLAAAGTLAYMIPPSIPMILYSAMTDVSVAKMFAAGFLPGLVMVIGYMVTAMIYCRRYKLGIVTRSSWRVRLVSTGKALPALFAPVVILGGMYSGVFTPTESAVVASLYCLVIGAFIYRRLNLKITRESLTDAMRLTAMVFLIIGCSMFLGRVLTYAQIPQRITQMVISYGLTSISFLLLTSLLLMVLGCFLEAITMIYVVVPIVFPAILALHIDPIHFGAILMTTVMLAVITPPVGMNLYVMSGLAEIPIGDVIKGVSPFIITTIVLLAVVIFWPDLSLFVPRLMYR